ncbi:MAG TPA: hypothetical protein VJO53_11185 [Candidatus Acidoferrales bacterium]|nr:hypothetical protein [Candidatus Acidoferrales bacterium]
MNLFGRKGAAGGHFRAGQADGNGDSPSVSHRLTLDLTRAETFATMLARSRASSVVEITDLLAGMYICNWDRLSRYWEEHDREEVESMLRGICRISPQRWHSWMEFYECERGESGGGRGWHWLRRQKPEQPGEKPLQPSSALADVLKQAEGIAPSRDRFEDRTIPILTSECVLLCIFRNYGSEVSRRLAETGLDAKKLERDALFPRRSPRK